MVLQTRYQNMNVGNEEALKAMIVLHSDQFNIECRCILLPSGLSLHAIAISMEFLRVRSH